MTGMIGVAMSCEWGCSSEAPAASPWFLNTSAYSTSGSFRSSGIGLAVLTPERALEERGHRVHGRLAREEHGADLLTDRHRHRVPLRERQRGGDGACALGDHA